MVSRGLISRGYGHADCGELEVKRGHDYHKIGLIARSNFIIAADRRALVGTVTNHARAIFKICFFGIPVFP